MLSHMIEQLIKKLECMDVKTYMRGGGVKKLVRSMRSVHILALSAETQHKQLGSNSREVEVWLKKLKDALDDVVRLLDDFSTEDLRCQNKKDKKFQIFFLSSNQIFLSCKMVTKVKELTKRIEGLQKFSNFHSHPCEQRDLNERETHSFILEQTFIGREKEKKNLIKLLLDTNTNGNNNVSVISIIGKEGIGKTALAQIAYNDKEVQRHFEWKEWVWVSKFFNVPSIFAKIIEATDTNIAMQHIYRPLREKVDGKKYLLVLDDLWNESRFYWSNLMDILNLGAKGSKIIITTRSEKVAMITTNSSMSITLDKLNEEHSWRMFSLFAFDDEKEPENQNLVSICKEIVKKCNGIPLAIYTIGCCEQSHGVVKRTEIGTDEFKLSNKIEYLIEKLGSIDVKSWNIRGDLFENWVENMYVIEGAVLCAEKLQRKHGTNTHVVKLWLKKLKDVLDDVFHLLDQLSTEHIRRQDKKNKKVQIFASSSNQLVFSSKMATKIKDLAKRTEGLKNVSDIYPHPCEQLQPIVKRTEKLVDQFFGREKEKKELIDFLLNPNNNAKGNVSVIFIIGDEGIGKSALAEIAYDDKEVQQYFELREWEWISNLLDIKSIGEKIAGFHITLESVRKKIHSKFEGKRYLLVLDDMLIDHSDIWFGLMSLMEVGAKGSKIIVTTRSKKLPMITKTINPSLSITLNNLEEEHCWRMFCLYAFEDKKEPENQDIMSTGKEIVKKCFGIPLAVFSIAFLMRSSATQNWSSFKNKNLVEIDEQGILAIYHQNKQ